MNQEKQPEALQGAIRSMMMRIETLHAENVSQRAQLVAEAARTAEEKLRADQMTEQHRMQCNISKSAVATLVGLGYTDQGGEQWTPPIGKAPDFNLLDAAHARIADLEAQLSAIGAGGVESLCKREQECGNCFEGKSDLDHTCRKCGGSGAAAPAQAQDDRAAFKAYLQECDDCAIVPDVAGAFHAAWQKRAAPAQAVAVSQVYTAQPLKNEAQGFICDMALEYGAELLNDEGTIYSFNQEQLIAFTEANRSAPAQEDATQLAGQGLHDIEAGVEVMAWLRENRAPHSIYSKMSACLFGDPDAPRAAPAQAHKDEQA